VSTLRQWLYGLALLGVLAGLLYTQHLRLALADAATSAAQERTARKDAAISVLTSTLDAERQAQASLRNTQALLRQSLTDRQLQIKELKRENEELRLWADQQLPAAARSLRRRPALIGAASYRDWLSSSRALQPAGSSAQQ